MSVLSIPLSIYLCIYHEMTILTYFKLSKGIFLNFNVGKASWWLVLRLNVVSLLTAAAVRKAKDDCITVTFCQILVAKLLQGWWQWTKQEWQRESKLWFWIRKSGHSNCILFVPSILFYLWTSWHGASSHFLNYLFFGTLKTPKNNCYQAQSRSEYEQKNSCNCGMYLKEKANTEVWCPSTLKLSGTQLAFVRKMKVWPYFQDKKIWGTQINTLFFPRLIFVPSFVWRLFPGWVPK